MELKKNAAGVPVRPLGKTGLEVSIIGLGGGHLSRPHVSEADAVRIVQTAVDGGVTFFDNAWDYGDGASEERMGRALQGRRDNVVLMTKVCARDRKTAENHLDDSLRRLRTDVIDVWQFHEINYENDPEWIFAPTGALEAAVAARKAGKIRFIGFTGHKSPHIHLKMLQQDFAWDTCQVPTNVMDSHFRSFEKEILPALNHLGIAPLGMKSLGGKGQLVTAVGLSPLDCRRYALSLPIATLIVGVESLEDLRQDLQIARNFTPMTQQEKAAILKRTHDQAGDGRHEWFKTTQYFDSKYHRDQHSYPPLGNVRGT